MKQIFRSKEACAGCTACYAVCPVKAIEMIADEEGFLYPLIQEDKCINCGKCERVCPLENPSSRELPLHIFAAKHQNEAVRACSSSGGVFSLLAEYVVREGGVVYGAAFDDNFVVRHVRGETREQWTRFRTSKYVQSCMGDVFEQVRRDLREGKNVLFTGTPCQIDGLTRAVKGTPNVENLITCDIVCHGVPSPKIWAEWLKYIQKQGKFQIGHINFRDKDQSGWHDSMITVQDHEGRIRIREKLNVALFSKLFVNNLILRPSCHHCAYANFRRPGDITLGDFWGIDRHKPMFDDNKGVSLVMCNTEKGYELLQAVSAELELWEVEQQQAAQPNLEKPSEKPSSRAYFWKWYQRLGLVYASQLTGMMKPGLAVRTLMGVKKLLKR